MKCPDAFIAALKRLLPCDFRAFSANYPPASAGDCHTASNTSERHSRGVTLLPASEIMIHTRAIRLHNRSPSGAAKYVNIQSILNRGN